MFIKLTHSTTPEGTNVVQNSGELLVINSAAVLVVNRGARQTYTTIVLRNSKYYVRETPEEIFNLIENSTRGRTRTGLRA